MTTYTTIPDGDIDQDSPVTQPLMTALRDNPIAITEGASGAPRIATAALKAPTAGTSHIIMRLQESENASGSATTTYPSAQFHNRHDEAQHLGVTCLVAGTITCYLQHRSGSSTSYVRILKNGVQLAEWGVSSVSGTVARQLNVSVAVGDSIIFQQRSGDGNLLGFWKLLRIYSNNPDMAVA